MKSSGVSEEIVVRDHGACSREAVHASGMERRVHRFPERAATARAPTFVRARDTVPSPFRDFGLGWGLNQPQRRGAP